MKRFLKVCMSIAVALVCVVTFSACKKPVSATTVDLTKVVSTNGATTNGGFTAVYDGYIYFINGTKTNDGSSATFNTKSAIYRAKYNTADDSIDTTSYELVVSDLVGFEDGSLYFFGDYMYYATPCNDVNSKAEKLYNKTSFMRYDLVNKQSYKLFTTSLNNSEETISYAYYVVGTELNLLIYETTNATITSLKINEKVSTNYVISNVSSCLFSENYGTCVTTGATKDANNFVFYTKAHEDVDKDKVQTGNKVYRTDVALDTSVCIYDGGASATLLSIRNGKLVFTINSVIYANVITGAANEVLNLDSASVISYATYENIMFIENSDGSISVLYYDTTSYELNVLLWNGSTPEAYTINEFTKDAKFEFISLVTLAETEEAEGDNSAVTHQVSYLIYINSSSIYKIEVARDGKYEDSIYSEPIKLTNTSVQSAKGVLVPEVIGKYLYILSEDSDKNIYLYRTDVTIDVNASELEKTEDKTATFIGVKE